MNHTSSSHSGVLVTAEGDDLEVELELIGGTTLRMSAAGDELGAWPVADCHLEPHPDRPGAYRLVVDGDDATFTPVDPIGFRPLAARLTGGELPAAPAVAEPPSADPGPAPSSVVDTGGTAADDPVAFLFGSARPPTPSGPEFAPQEAHAGDAPESGWPTEPETSIEPEPPTESEMSAPQVPAEPHSPIESPLSPEPESPIESRPSPEPESPIESRPSPEPELPTLPGFAAGDQPDRVDEFSFTDDHEDLVDADEPSVVSEPIDGADEGLDFIPSSQPVDPQWAPGRSVDSDPDGPESEDVQEIERLEALFAEGREFDEPIAADTSATEIDDDESFRGRFGGGSAIDKLSAAIGAMKQQPEDIDPDSDYVVGPNTVAEDVLTSQRTLRDHRMKTENRRKWVKTGAVLVGAAAVIALFAVLTPRALDFIQNYEGDAEPPPALPVTATTAASTTTATPTPETAVDATTIPVAAGSGTVFELPAPEFVARWDSAGGSIDPVLTFDSLLGLGPFEERFTPYLAMRGTVQPSGTLQSFSLEIDPNGPAEYDRIGIQALGVAIATVDPERSPEGRATLLGQLGLNVRQPQLGGIDGTVEADGVIYRLVYDEAAALLTLTVSPAG